MSRGFGQMGQGIIQYAKGKKAQKEYDEKRPKLEADYNQKTADYEAYIQRQSNMLSDAMARGQERYKKLADQGIPEQQRQNYLRDVDRNTTSTLSQSSSRRGGLAGLGQLNQNNTDAYSDLLQMDAGARMQNQQRYAEVAPQFEAQGIAAQSAPYQFRYARDSRMEGRNFQDIYDTRAYGRAMEGAGVQNFNEGWAQVDTDVQNMFKMMSGMGAMGGGGSGGGGIDGGNKDYSASSSAQQGAGQYGKATNEDTWAGNGGYNFG